ncbi:MAG TPA: elongation factor 4 [Syntrophaceticus sp.]|jgi:GTP-binding protein LepA|nr:translation elongation factor 4 [Syntrophaceticus schinkii]MDD4260916.1 translation elongation factor 4 [Syntrophaceticus schinkii]MDD4674264.1 translation elongation factor 4 [Syntrophaceticus schinkii]HHY30434.1 elongation factor 4 [Syntrophaceticus sp.]
MKQELIRNFCIIAHIDHGKSTLADRFLELTGALESRQMRDQVLDQMDLERERGITIKLTPARMNYQAADGQEYILNLIDTPGHVDFSYEVSRSLNACEGALLIVDASQGVEAQTIANTYLALDANLEIIPVINKIDLSVADPDRVAREIEDVIGLDTDDILLVSAKEGEGVKELLETLIRRVPFPQGDAEKPLQALIFDSHFDPYRGAISYIRVFHGCVRPGIKIMMMATGKSYEVSEVGVFAPSMHQVDELGPGEVGYLAAGIKEVADTRVGDTITDANKPASSSLPGYRKVLPVVFCGLYPVEANDFENLRDALEKLRLNDASFQYEPETSAALGFGFRCGFLGLLHMEIIQERLEREYGLELVTTAPNVVYRLTDHNGETVTVDNPANWPETGEIAVVEEPYVQANVITPADYVGAVMELFHDRRGEYQDMSYLSPQRVQISYQLPLSEIIFDFFDILKSCTRGFASFDYELSGYRAAELVKLDCMVHGEMVDALSIIVHREQAQQRARSLVDKLRRLIPRQLFDVPIQASIGSRVIARETVKALRKNVLEKCYGGDVTRKRKLLEKQKEGKRRMKQVGRVEIPQEAFLAVLQVDKE